MGVRARANHYADSAASSGRRVPGKFRRVWPAALMLALGAPLLAAAQGNPVPVRVTDRVDISRMTTLTGNRHALAQAKFDQGAAPPDLPMNRMMLLLKRSPEQESALQDLLVQQQVTSSATFHKWLTPDQFGQQFGPADADVQAVTSWLSSFGFQSIKVSRGRTVIEFSGTASQVQSALHTSIHKYVVNGENHWANSSDPQVPTALAPVIAGFASLHDFHPKTAMTKLSRNVAGTVTSGPRPQVNLSGGRHALVPADFNKIYNVGTSMTGNGVTIGIIASSNINVSDVVAFRNLWGLPANSPNIIPNGPLPAVAPGSGGEGEAILDATWAGAVAPAATIDLVVSEDTNAANGTDLSEFYIVDNNLADVMTESFQACESQFGSSLSGAESFIGGMAEQAAAQGITFLVSSGDGGPDACDDPSTEPATITTPSVNILASTPFNVAVGGTMFNDIANPNTYWNPPTANSSGNGQTGGSALSYIPEDVWNESCTVTQFNQNLCPASGLWSSGGGQSSIVSKPPWQAGVSGIPGANFRFLPDVSMNAADHDGYILCIDGSCPNLFGIASGTSASVQVFGGVMALVVQKVGARVGIANYALYKLAAGGPPTNPANSAVCNASNTTTLPLSTCIFNDVTTGNTNVPVLAGFSAGTGFDETTGLGSVNVTNLVNSWSSAITKASTTTLRLNGGNLVNVTHGTAVSVQIAVTAVAPATGTPTGDVSLVSSNSASDSGVDSFTLLNGSVNGLANSTTLLPGGTYQVHAHYEGDSAFVGSDSPAVPVTVTPEASQINFGIVVNSGASGCTATSLPYGSSYVLTVDVADSLALTTPCSPNVSGSNPTGTVTLTDSLNGGTTLPLDGGTFKLNSFAFFEDQTIQLPAGTHAIKASYLGDNSFSPSGPASGVITITPAATTTTVSANPVAAAAGTNVVLTATVSTQSNATANASQEPSGSVQFFANGASLGTVPVVGGVSPTTFFAQGVATLPTSTLPSEQNAITAKYLGDTNYAPSAVSSSVTVTIGSSAINVVPGCTSSTITITAPGQSGSCLITVTGPGGFAGSVALSVVGKSAPPSAVDTPTCTFGAPSQNFTPPGTITLTPSSETGNATLTCASQAASRILLRPASRPMGRTWPLAGAALSLACIFFLLSVPKQRRWSYAPLALVVVVIAAAVACGGGSSGGVTNPGTTTGAYTFTVTATPSGGTSAQTTITVNVQ
jgi:subtilase family serine protease